MTVLRLAGYVHLLQQDIRRVKVGVNPLALAADGGDVLQHYQGLAGDAAQAQLSYERYLLALTEQEIAQRERNRQTQCIKAARFPLLKELADFDFRALPSLNKQMLLELAQGGYIPRHEAILLVGNPGLGKTHVATGLALAACRQGHRLRFYNTAALVSELLLAQDEHRLPRLLQNALKQHLIVLDELGFIPFILPGAQLLFQFCSTLYERVAFIITTNLRFADWSQVFGDERLTAALLDRLTHHAHIIEFRGESYRLRERLQHDPATLSVTSPAYDAQPASLFNHQT